MKLSFFLPMIPPTVTAQTHRITARPGQRAQVYDSPQLRDARQKYLAYLCKHAPNTPFQGPLLLIVKWYFPHTGRTRNGQYKATRPDTDNLLKLFKDCMTRAGFWHDDAQVASEVVEKQYADTPGIYVLVMEMDEVT